MSKTLMLIAGALLLLANFCGAGRTHYYGGSGYPTLGTYNQGPYRNQYGYGANGFGLNSYGIDGYPGYQDYDSYDGEDYNVDGTYGDYGGYQGPYGSSQYPYGSYQYPYGYQRQVLPKIVSSPLVNEYVAPLPPVSKSITTSSLYQTHPTGYGSGSHGYAGGYGYGPKYGSVYGNGYYRK